MKSKDGKIKSLFKFYRNIFLRLLKNIFAKF